MLINDFRLLKKRIRNGQLLTIALSNMFLVTTNSLVLLGSMASLLVLLILPTWVIKKTLFSTRLVKNNPIGRLIDFIQEIFIDRLDRRLNDRLRPRSSEIGPIQ